MSSYKPLDITTIPLKGTHLIEASAGTGKTYTLSHLFLRLILEEHYDVRSILVVTFTEAATKELIERIRTNLSEAYRACNRETEVEDELLQCILKNSFKHQSAAVTRTLLRKAMIRFDEASIYTIHGFCKRILADYAFETSFLFDSELVADQRKLILDITDDFWRTTFSDKPSIFTEIALKYNLNTAGLASFAGLLLRMPAAELIPDIRDSPFEKVNQCLQRMADEWKASGREICRIMHEDKALRRDQRRYRQDVLEGYIAAIEQVVQGAFPPDWLNAVSMLAQETINGSVKKNSNPPSHPFFEHCQHLVRCEKETAVWIKQTFASFLRLELAKRKRDLSIHTFDDLISTVHRTLVAKSEGDPLLDMIRDTYRVALVDEFQDTDAMQYEIFRKIFADHNGNLFLIGDPKQSIYSFRGADLFTYFQAAKSVKKECGYTLNTNWRSETGMVEAINALFSKPINPFVLGQNIEFTESLAAEKSKGNQAELSIVDDKDSHLVLWYLNQPPQDKKRSPLNKEDAGQRAINLVAGEIVRLLNLSEKGLATVGHRELRPSDMAILVLRNSDAQALKDCLIRLNVPAVVTKSGDVFHSTQASDLQLILEAVASPLRMTSLNTALVTEMIGFTGNEIRDLVEDESQRDTYEEHITRFSHYRNLWQVRGFMPMFRKLMVDYQIRKNLIRLPAGERKLTNLLHLAELIHSQAVTDKPGINGLLSWLQQQRNSQEMREEHELRLERDDEAVQIATVFKSKGLQYPVVFCPFMWQRSATIGDNTISYHRDDKLILDLGSETQAKTGLDLAETERLADLVRLLYVALTRAQNRCYLVCGRIGRRSANPLDYILTGGKLPKPGLVPRFIEELSKWDEERFLAEIKETLQHKQITIKLDEPTSDAATLPFQPQIEQEAAALSCRTFQGHHPGSKDWGIASYSKLIAGESYRHHTEDDLLLIDELSDPIGIADEPGEDAFFSFPGGRLAGTCLHSVFEKLDFVDPAPDLLSEVVRQELIRFNLIKSDHKSSDQGVMQDSVVKMLARVFSSPLKSAARTITLDRIDTRNKLVEFEFHFPVSRLTAEKLHELLLKGANPPDHKIRRMVERLKQLNFKPVAGFMHGFIDLVFRYEDRYYIVDWKSNNLGSSYAAYHPEKLEAVMSSHLYDLQYHIYTVALDHYLQARVPDYDYNQHFGGVFYLFVRGMRPDLPGNGVFYDLPSKELVSGLGRMIR